jgi:glycerol-3-phosphate cytidylyltransferase
MIIKNKSKLKKIIEQAKSENKSVLIKKGVFDLIHPGHIFAIDLFSKKADIVIILIQSDEFTKKKKGKERPINPQLQRAQVIDGIKGVDYVYLDKSNSREEYITFLNYLKPTILVITAESKAKDKAYSSKYWKLIAIPDKKDYCVSTTEIINRVLKNYRR